MVAVQRLAKNSETTIESVFEEVLQSLEPPMSLEERCQIRRYIVASLGDGEARDTPERYVGPTGKLPPVFVWAAFDKEDGFAPRRHPAQMLLLDSALSGSERHLTHFGMYYDQLRALERLPVVPRFAELHGGDKGHFFKLFCLRRECAKQPTRDGRIFEIKGDGDGSVYVADGWQPSLDCYMLPSDPNHPWIDRACVAFGPADEPCLVIYKDNITVNGFPEALHHLSCAATCMQEFLVGYDVLCVAQVVQTSAVAVDISDFQHPIVLVCQQEFALYYGKTFAVPISQAIDRNQPSSTTSSGYHEDSIA